MATQFVTGHAKGRSGFECAKQAVEYALKKITNEPDIILIFASPNYASQDILAGVRSVLAHTPIIGCSSAGEFTEEVVTKEGVVCVLIKSDEYRFYTGMGKNITYSEIDAIKHAAKDFPKEVPSFPYKSVMMLIDGLAGKGEEVVLAAKSVLGEKVKFAGGAAADNWELFETHVFQNEEAHVNAVTLCMIASKQPVIIAVKHGHEPISPPLKITKSKDNVVYEVNGERAIDVWKHYLRESFKKDGVDIDIVHDTRELSRLLGKYEAGLLTGNQYRNRFTFSVGGDGSLRFGCSMLEGSVFKIMSSSEENQIRSSEEAALKALELARGKKLAGAIVFDCACRGKILQEKFPLAVESIKKVLKDLPIVGFETYGEIAMDEGQLSGYHNATTVIMLFTEENGKQ